MAVELQNCINVTKNRLSTACSRVTILLSYRFSMSSLTINSITLNIIDVGAGQPVVWLHGLGSCGADWCLQTPVFSQHFRVIAPDLRGHGHSASSIERVTIPRLAQDIVALMDALHLPSAHIVGWSLGGTIAQQLAIDFPDRVDRLVLTNTFAHLWPTNSREALILIRRAIVSMLLPLNTTGRVVAADLFPRPDQAELRQAVIDRVGGNNVHAYRKFIGAIRRFDVRQQLSRIHAPTLVVTGDHDNVVPRGCQLQLVHSIPQVEWKLIKDSGHATPIDQPEEFNRFVMEFLKAEG